MSRTPVREAVQRLVHEQLLEQAGRRGTFVCDPGREQLIDCFEAQQVIASHAADAAARAIGPATLVVLEQLVAQMTALSTSSEADTPNLPDPSAQRRHLKLRSAFMRILAAIAGNRRLERHLSKAQTLILIVCSRGEPFTWKSMEESAREHDRLLMALRNGDGRAAANICTDIHRRLKQQMLERLTRGLSPDSAGRALADRVLEELDL